MKKLRTYLAVTLLALAAGCGGDDSTGEPGPVPGDDDTTPPEVVSVSPQDGATGVRTDAAIQIEFSESMDPVVTEAAISTEGLGTPSFEWNDELVGYEPGDCG